MNWTMEIQDAKHQLKLGNLEIVKKKLFDP